MGDDLARMYRLFARVPDGLAPIAEIVKQHIADVGNEKIEQRLARAEGKEEKETNDDPQFVKVIQHRCTFLLLISCASRHLRCACLDT